MTGPGFRWHGAAARMAVARGGAAGLKKWADDVLEATTPHVPVAPVRGGFLRDSGAVAVDGEALVAAVSYDSPPGTHLAIWVHEEMTDQHTVGEAKFLENTLNGSQATGLDAIASEIRRELDRVF